MTIVHYSRMYSESSELLWIKVKATKAENDKSSKCYNRPRTGVGCNIAWGTL